MDGLAKKDYMNTHLHLTLTNHVFLIFNADLFLSHYQKGAQVYQEQSPSPVGSHVEKQMTCK